MISIITPIFNSKEYMVDSIQSVINQSYTEWELLLLDDCSTDGSYEIAINFAAKDPRIKVIKNSKNLGVSETRNQGIKVARGDWIAFLDSDDIWENNKLELQLDLAQQTGGQFIYGSYKHITLDGKFKKEIYCSKSINYQEMLSGSEIGCLTVMIRADVLRKHKFLNVFHEDYILWLEILKKDCPYAYAVQKPIARYRLRPGSRSANKWECAKAQWNIYRHQLGINWFRSSLYFIQYIKNGISKHWITRKQING